MEIKKILSQNLFTITIFNIIFDTITLTSQNETIHQAHHLLISHETLVLNIISESQRNCF